MQKHLGLARRLPSAVVPSLSMCCRLQGHSDSVTAGTFESRCRGRRHYTPDV